jgi:hypothetical protein
MIQSAVRFRQKAVQVDVSVQHCSGPSWRLPVAPSAQGLPRLDSFKLFRVNSGLHMVAAAYGRCAFVHNIYQ